MKRKKETVHRNDGGGMEGAIEIKLWSPVEYGQNYRLLIGIPPDTGFP